MAVAFHRPDWHTPVHILWNACNLQVFHRMDSMLKDTNYTAELDALRRTTHDAAVSDMQTGGQNHFEHNEEDGQVSTSEALDMLRQVCSRLLWPIVQLQQKFMH